MSKNAASVIKDAFYAARLFRLCDEFTRKESTLPAGPDLAAIIENAQKAALAAVKGLPEDLVLYDLAEVSLEQAGQMGNKLVETCENLNTPQPEKTDTAARLKREFCWYVTHARRYNTINTIQELENLWADSCRRPDGMPLYRF